MKVVIRSPAAALFFPLALLFFSACAQNAGAQGTPALSPVPSPTPSATEANPSESESASPAPSPTPSPAPSPTPDYGIFADSCQKAESLLKTMTPEERTGQLFLARYPGDRAVSDAQEYNPGGYILFANDFKEKTPQQVKDMIDACRTAGKIPLLIGVDEEGGTVVRVSKNPLLRPTPFLSPQALFLRGGLDEIARDARDKSRFLLSLGINLNLAPVADVSVNKNDFIYRRSFGKPADETAQYVKTVVTATGEENLSCTLKHFPGYGNNADTHTGGSEDARPFKTFQSSDFLPFEAGIEAGAQSILVNHLTVKCMDGTLPASLSPKVHEILRDELHFSGVIMTDDLGMDALKGVGGKIKPAVLAVLAGNDMMISSDLENDYAAVLAAVADGTVRQELIDRAALRVLSWKIHMGIIK